MNSSRFPDDCLLAVSIKSVAELELRCSLHKNLTVRIEVVIPRSFAVDLMHDFFPSKLTKNGEVLASN